MKTLGNMRFEIITQTTNQTGGPKKFKDRALKEITNKLEVGAIKLKLTWANSKFTGDNKIKR